MASPTKLESKLAEVPGLALAAQDAVREVRGMLGGDDGYPYPISTDRKAPHE